MDKKLCTIECEKKKEVIAASRDRTNDLEIFSLTLSQLSYRGYAGKVRNNQISC